MQRIPELIVGGGVLSLLYVLFSFLLLLVSTGYGLHTLLYILTGLAMILTLCVGVLFFSLCFFFWVVSHGFFLLLLMVFCILGANGSAFACFFCYCVNQKGAWFMSTSSCTFLTPPSSTTTSILMAQKQRKGGLYINHSFLF
jgi:hypothetical protein